MPYTFYSLIVEMGLNVGTLVLGLVLAFRNENRPLRIWGWWSAAAAMMMLWDNLAIILTDPSMEYYHIFRVLDIGRMFKWCLMAYALSFIPIVALRPGWLNRSRVAVFSLPFILALVILGCFMWFNGVFTPLNDVWQIWENITFPDVQMRLLFFCFTLIAPVIMYTLTFSGVFMRYRRRASLGMYTLLAMMGVTAVFYSLLMFAADELWVWYGYCYTIQLLPMVFSIMCIVSDNPVTIPPTARMVREQSLEAKRELEAPRVEDPAGITPQVQQLFIKMNEHMAHDISFTDPEYSLEQLVTSLNTNKRLLNQVIQYAGFTGFREYISFLRMEYFKQLAAVSPGASVSTLMYQCGYNSRTTFYRQFAEREAMSPKEYIKKLQAQEMKDIIDKT